MLYRSDLVNTALSELYHANSTMSGDNATAYDALGRLTAFSRGTLSASGNNGSSPDKVASPTGSQSWTLDALGNWSSVTTNGSATTQTFNSNNQTTAISGGTAPTYDLDGNTLTQSGQSYVYDAWNRLVAVKNSGGTTIASYAYDALGDRITETYSGTVNHLYYDANGNVIEERQGGTAATNITYQYVWGESGNLILRDTYSAGVIVPASRLYALHDANGDTTALVNTSGTVVERYEYSPYGQVTVLNAAGTPVSGNVSAYGWRYLYQGGRLDTTSGLYIFGARDYNPALGTWMQRDPLGLAAGTANIYQFVGSNPTNLVDPSGLMDEPIGGWEWPLWSGLKEGVATFLTLGLNHAGEHFDDAFEAHQQRAMGNAAPGSNFDASTNGANYQNGNYLTPELSGDLQNGASQYVQFAAAGGPASLGGMSGRGGMRPGSGQTPKPCPAPNSLLSVPGRVQSRVNLANKGWGHLVGRHFSGKTNASQFTVTQAELRGLLQSKQVVGTPVTRTLQSADGIRYVREVDLGRQIGLDKFNNFSPTNIMSILTDEFGNLVTATPGIIK